MKHFIFTIYDSKAEAFLPPFFMHQKGMAIRAFTDSVNNEQSQISLHPADYNLFHIGEFDDNSAEITITTKTPMGNGIEFVKSFAEHVDQQNLEFSEKGLQSI